MNSTTPEREGAKEVQQRTQKNGTRKRRRRNRSSAAGGIAKRDLTEVEQGEDGKVVANLGGHIQSEGNLQEFHKHKGEFLRGGDGGGHWREWNGAKALS